MTTLLALDIDGTVVDASHKIVLEVRNYFKLLHEEGVCLAFVTGRGFEWSEAILQSLAIPYFLVIHNGAIALSLPGQKLLFANNLDHSIFEKMDQICKEESTDYVVYSGYAGDDICYYRPKRLSPALREYLARRTEAFCEKWVAVDSFTELPINLFPSIKCFGGREEASCLSKKIEERLNLHAPMIRDPFDPQVFVVQATNKSVNKGEAVKQLSTLIEGCDTIIAAGDDLNDLPMLLVADKKIVMEGAPEELMQVADVIAPSVTKNGIIEGIKKIRQGI